LILFWFALEEDARGGFESGKYSHGFRIDGRLKLAQSFKICDR
jgi:hypothetical protein